MFCKKQVCLTVRHLLSNFFFPIEEIFLKKHSCRWPKSSLMIGSTKRIDHCDIRLRWGRSGRCIFDYPCCCSALNVRNSVINKMLLKRAAIYISVRLIWEMCNKTLQLKATKMRITELCQSSIEIIRALLAVLPIIMFIQKPLMHFTILIKNLFIQNSLWSQVPWFAVAIQTQRARMKPTSKLYFIFPVINSKSLREMASCEWQEMS